MELLTKSSSYSESLSYTDIPTKFLLRHVIVLEQQRSNGFYLLTAYHLNKEYGLKALEKKMKKRLQTPL